MKTNVKFNGKEYLEYLKYQDQKREKFWEKNKWQMTILLSILILSILFFAVVETLTAQPTQGFNYSWEGILMFLSIAMGISWIIHGFGFILVRR